MIPRLIHLLPSRRWGDAERYVLDTCRHFSDRGWSVTAYTVDARLVDNAFRASGIHLRTAPLRGFFDWATIRLLAADLKRERPGTIIHTHRHRDALNAMLACRLARRPDIRLVNTRHTVKRAHLSPIHTFIFTHLAAQIFPSAAARDAFMSSWRQGRSPLPEERVHVLPPRLLDALPDDAGAAASGPLVIEYFGRVSPRHGVETLIDALPRLKGRRSRLAITGSGNPEYVDTLRRRALLAGVNDMIDWTIRPCTASYPPLRRCHIAVFPDVDPIPYSLLQQACMAAGRPVVATNNGAQPEYIRSGHDGILIPPADASQLAEALIALIEQPEMRSSLGANAAASVDAGGGYDAFASALERIYLGE